VKNGKALPARIYVVHLDSSARTFKTRLTKAFPKAGWTDQASENKLKKSQSYALSLAIKTYVEREYDSQPIKTSRIKAGLEQAKRTSTHKKTIGSGPFSERVWKDAITLFLQSNSEWARQGHRLMKVFHKMKFEDDTAA
jgi:hypothetical protein